MEQYAELIERLEKAEGPDRRLDVEIATLVSGLSADHFRDAIEEIGIKGMCGWEPDEKEWPRYTASIDAALTLMLAGWEPHTLTFPHGTNRTFAFEIFPPKEHPAWQGGSVIGRGKTAATAIAGGYLKARTALAARPQGKGEGR